MSAVENPLWTAATEKPIEQLRSIYESELEDCVILLRSLQEAAAAIR